jgi:ribose transport system substrate-binding protein
MTSYAMMNLGKKEKKYVVSVIVSDSNNDRWAAMREGLEQAGSDESLEINIVSTGKLRGIQEEKNLINREVENGTDGIILQLAASSDMTDELEDISSKTKIVLTDTDCDPSEVYASVTADNKAIGKAIGEAIKADYKGNMKNLRIGIMLGNQNQLSLQQRLDGLKESLAGTGICLSWSAETAETEKSRDFDEKEKKNPVDIVVALNNDDIESAVDFLNDVSNKQYKFKLYGEGCSEKAVYFLDKGLISTMIVPNEFNMGYESAMALADQLKQGKETIGNTRVDFLVINKSNLYQEENQKILFPIVQ